MQSSSSIPFSQDPELGLLGQCSSASAEPLGDKKVDEKKMAGRKQDKRCVILFTFLACFLVGFILCHPGGFPFMAMCPMCHIRLSSDRARNGKTGDGEHVCPECKDRLGLEQATVNTCGDFPPSEETTSINTVHHNLREEPQHNYKSQFCTGQEELCATTFNASKSKLSQYNKVLGYERRKRKSLQREENAKLSRPLNEVIMLEKEKSENSSKKHVPSRDITEDCLTV